MTIPPVLVEMSRAGIVESQHRGHAVLLDAAGKIEVSLGEPTKPIFPRSAIKLAQATALVPTIAKSPTASAISVATGTPQPPASVLPAMAK